MPVSLLHNESHICDYCHRPHKPVYRTQVGADSPTYWLGVNCRALATENWRQNKEQGLQNITKPVEREADDDEYKVEDNI